MGPAEILRRLDRIAQGEGDTEVALEALLRDVGTDPQILGLVSRTLGGVGYRLRQAGEAQRALTVLRAACRSLEAAGQADAEDAAVALNNLSVALRELGHADEALKTGRRAVGRVQRGTELYGQILNNLGDLQSERGELGEAVALLSEALEIQRAMDPESVVMARKHNNLGNAQLMLGEPLMALDSYLRALRIHENYKPDGADTANTRRNVGRTLIALGRDGEARSYLQAALEAHERLAPEGLDTAISLNLMGQLELHEGRPAPAVNLIERAVRILESGADESLALVDALVVLAGARVASGDVQSAIVDYERAQALVVDSGAGSLSHALLLEGLGAALATTGDRDAAIATYQEAVATAERLRARGGAPDGRVRLFEARMRPYQALIGLHAERGGPGDQAAAFSYAEAARGRALGDLLAERAVGAMAGAPEELVLLEREDELQHALAATHEARLRGADDAIAEELALEQELQMVAARLRAASPALRHVRALEPIGLDDARAALAVGTLVLVYDATGAETFVWALRRDGTAMGRMPVDGESLARHVRELVGECEARASLRFTAAMRQRLGAALLDGVPPEMWSGADRLIVVPDGALNYLPFDLLPRPGGNADDLLLDAFPISFAPSCSLLRYLAAERSGRAATWTSGEFVAFADPVFPDAAAPAEGDRIIRGIALEPLPGTRVEANAIAAHFGGDTPVWLGAEATEWRVKTGVAGYRYVHLATHGRIDDERPLFCGLALSPPQPFELAQNATLDAWLQTYEMLGLPLTAELVVCSACQTALGAVHEGEGVVGMTRALLAAGALCVVSSLWSVPDDATAVMMDRFYAELIAGVAIDEALRRAKRHVHDHACHAEPFHWAAFVPFGLSG